MSTQMQDAVHAAAQALAQADGVDYFEVLNLAGIADYELVASTVLEAASASKPGVSLPSLAGFVGAVESGARALAKAERSDAFRAPTSDEAAAYRQSAHTILAAVLAATRPTAA